MWQKRFANSNFEGQRINDVADRSSLVKHNIHLLSRNSMISSMEIDLGTKALGLNFEHDDSLLTWAYPVLGVNYEPTHSKWERGREVIRVTLNMELLYTLQIDFSGNLDNIMLR